MRKMLLDCGRHQRWPSKARDIHPKKRYPKDIFSKDRDIKDIFSKDRDIKDPFPETKMSKTTMPFSWWYLFITLFIAFNYCMCFALLHQRRIQKKNRVKLWKEKKSSKTVKRQSYILLMLSASTHRSDRTLKCPAMSGPYANPTFETQSYSSFFNPTPPLFNPTIINLIPLFVYQSHSFKCIFISH